MAATISFHNGTSVHRGHNRRDKWIADKESHIDPDGHFEIWHDEKLTDAYDRIFGQAVAEYNAKQKRQDRKIGSYYEQIRQGNSERNLVYETIIGVYKSDVSEETQREILRRVYEAWPKRYPNFEIVGAYYHADEEGEPHLHVDYIPVATGYKRGMEKQNGLVKALEQMGFVKDGKEFAISKWQADGRELLDHICANYGIKTHHPQAGKGIPHVETQAYKIAQQLIDEIEPLAAQKKGLETEINKLSAARDGLDRLVKRQEQKLNSVIETLHTAEKDRSDAQNAVLSMKIELDSLSGEKSKKLAEIENLSQQEISGTQKLSALYTAIDTKKDELDELDFKKSKKEIEIQELKYTENSLTMRVAQLTEDIPKLPEFIREWGKKLSQTTRETLREFAEFEDAATSGTEKTSIPSFETFRENRREDTVLQNKDLYRSAPARKKTGRSR